MKLIKVKDFFTIILILILSLSSIIILFDNQDIFLDDDYLILRAKLNHSNNESIILCRDGIYKIISPYDFYICGHINKDIHLKK